MSETILLVDDERAVLNGLARALFREPYVVLTAESGEEALRILDRTHIDIIVSDARMPGMSGTELLATTRRIHPDVVRIMLTGEPDLESAVRTINDANLYRFLNKPVHPLDLRRTLRQALDLKRLDQERKRLRV